MTDVNRGLCFSPPVPYKRIMAINTIPWLKMNGLGNEILVLDLRGSGWAMSAAQIRLLAHRADTRFDQLMALHDARSPGEHAFVRIYNADGSEAEACGNGNRCVAWALARETGRETVAFKTAAGVIEALVASPNAITVDMGTPRFGWREIPLARAMDTNALDYAIEWGGGKALCSPSAVNVGNPHCIFWVKDVATIPLAEMGPRVEHDPLFPERVNVSFAQVITPDRITLKVWERGAGATKACGTAACATAVAAARRGLAARDVTVTLPGGDLRIRWRESDGRILMTGPAELEASGFLDAATVFAQTAPHAAAAGG